MKQELDDAVVQFNSADKWLPPTAGSSPALQIGIASIIARAVTGVPQFQQQTVEMQQAFLAMAQRIIDYVVHCGVPLDELIDGLLEVAIPGDDDD